MVAQKEELRKSLLLRRKELSPEVRKRKDKAILNLLSSLPEFRDAKRVLLYCSVKGEPDLSPLMHTLISKGREAVLPKVRGSELELLSVDSPGSLVRGRFNIPEPISGKRVDPSQLDLVIVPGVAFDRRGFRIGFGKGYYDRLLKKVKAPKVGVAYSFQVLNEVPRDTWDEPVDIIVTEKSIIRRL